MKTAMALRIFGVGRKLIGAYATHSVNCSKYTLRNICLSSVLNGTFAFCVFLNVSILRSFALYLAIRLEAVIQYDAFLV